MPKPKSYSVTDKLAVIASTKCGELPANVACDNGVPQ